MSKGGFGLTHIDASLLQHMVYEISKLEEQLKRRRKLLENRVMSLHGEGYSAKQISAIVKPGLTRKML